MPHTLFLYFVNICIPQPTDFPHRKKNPRLTIVTLLAPPSSFLSLIMSSSVEVAGMTVVACCRLLTGVDVTMGSRTTTAWGPVAAAAVAACVDGCLVGGGGVQQVGLTERERLGGRAGGSWQLICASSSVLSSDPAGLIDGAIENVRLCGFRLFGYCFAAFILVMLCFENQDEEARERRGEEAECCVM